MWLRVEDDRVVCYTDDGTAFDDYATVVQQASEAEARTRAAEEQAQREATARAEAEAQARREAAARAELEARLRELEAKLRQLQGLP